MDSRNNIVSLSDEIESIETDVLKEEQINAANNYQSIKATIAALESQLPYPETKQYETGIDYEDISKLKYEKRANKSTWDKIDVIDRIYKCDDLYCGHFSIPSQNDYYITDNPRIETTRFQNMLLINADDRNHSALIRSWRYPNENQNVLFSRNIHMRNRNVESVDIIIDRQREILSKISDSYLRKALIENKNRYNITSIIQTIQEKQDQIRSLEKNISFFVQGCAGSGKTMVLLHRLRYLLFNKEINSNNFFLLIPGNRFKEYINSISREFNIDSSRILSYADYYQLLAGKTPSKAIESNDEMVFPLNYLGYVYSEEFIRKSYHDFFNVFLDQTNLLVEKCEGILNSLIEKSKKEYDSEILLLKNEAIIKVSEQLKPFGDFFSNKFDNKYEQIDYIIAELSNEIRNRENTIINSINDSYKSINSNDERIANNPEVLSIKKAIEHERVAIEKAPIFTKRSHKKKLLSLEEKLKVLFADIIATTINNEKERQLSSSLFCENVTLSDARAALVSINDIVGTITKQIDAVIGYSKNINHIIEENNSQQIDLLNSVIELSETYDEDVKPLIEGLIPSISILRKIQRKCHELYNSFISLVESDSLSEFDNGIDLFRIDNAELTSRLHSLLFSICKKRLKEEYCISVHSAYKHYWYINLYCYYLTNGVSEKVRKYYLFMDEVQDLSCAEFKLICKLNTFSGYGGVIEPVINAYGDINQVISPYGIKNWDAISNGLPKFELDENFRNTNQIIQYCNDNLQFKMKKIGIDMENVFSYSNLESAISVIKSSIATHMSNSNQPFLTFIVKDDYNANDLKTDLDKHGISDICYTIFTVHAVKGLEFKEVFVIDCNMTDNEKYIAYTRPLMKLSVIHGIPHSFNSNTPLFIQGEDE